MMLGGTVPIHIGMYEITIYFSSPFPIIYKTFHFIFFITVL